MKVSKRQLMRVIEQAIQGPGLSRGKDFAVGGSGEGKAAAMAVADEEYYRAADDYAMWVKENGHVTPAASSVMATYFLERGLEDDHELHEMLGNAFGIEHNDIMADIRRQESERAIMMGESNVKITKRQLRRIIKEEKAKMLQERVEHPLEGAAASAGSIAKGLASGMLTPESAAQRIEKEVKKVLYDFIRKEKDIARLENVPRGF